ncbi:MAG: signal peptidase I [Peptococcia bacterium]|jgi:signal peptidase
MIILTNTNLIPLTNNINFIYFGRPLLWFGVAATVYCFPRTRAAGRLSLRRFVLNLAIGAAVINILFMMVGGMITGLGKSPYAVGLVTSTINFIYISCFVLGLEATRSFLVNSYKGKRAYLTIALVSFFYLFTEISLGEILNFSNGLEFVRFFGSEFLPALAQSILTTYFAFLGGFAPAAVFHGILLAFEWFSPILPDLTWPMKTFLGCFIPAFSLLVVRHFYLLQAHQIKRNSSESEELFGWLVTSIISVALIWFAVGIFPIYPSVIVTGSMEPMIKPGDLVLVQKIDGEKVCLNDVIQYYDPEREISITHRVIAINRTDKITLTTKGDNNTSADTDSVLLGQVKGKVLKVVPKMGWLTLFLRSNQPIPEGVEN